MQNIENTLYPYKILFVDDEKIIRDNYTEYLRMQFEAVYEAEDGEVAFEVYQKVRPHILILDINLPKLSGLELLKKIRQTDHTTKAIILSAHENIDYLQEAVSLKLTKYLVKPVSRKALKESLDLVISELSNFSVISKKNIDLGDAYSWNFDTQELSLNNNLVALTNKETKLFSILINNVNKVCAVDSIIYDVWDNYDEGNLTTLKTIIKNLRKKTHHEIIKNVFGVGYKIEI